MKQYWNRFESWLQTNAPHLLQQLNDGAKQEDINTLEAIINKKLPAEFVDFYKIHDGQTNISEGLIDSEQLLSINYIIHEWKCWEGLIDQFQEDGEPYTSDPDKGIKNNWWNLLWVPITTDGCGNSICIDLDPTEDGNYGQVIQMWHDRGNRELYASSFTAWFDNYINNLESGKFVYVKKWGIVGKDSPYSEVENT